MSEIRLKRIRIYPIKACGGIELAQAQIEERGFQYDRRWLVMSDAGTFFDQLDHPRLASVVPQMHEDGLVLQAPGMSPLNMLFHLEETASVSVRISRSVCEAIPVGKGADEWFQDFLHASCRLVFMPETTRRAVNPDYALHQDIVSFASSYPYHLIGEASVAHVNQLSRLLCRWTVFAPTWLLACQLLLRMPGKQYVSINRCFIW